ncbi:MAG: SusC/RagA family TonB-linked outer membrane protein [Ferruginibacter sp.]
MKFFIRAACDFANAKVLFLLMLCLFTAFIAMGQQRNVSGTVRNSKTNAAVVNATVTVKGTTRSVATGENGGFTISANNDDVLLISSIGYSSHQVKVGTRSNLSVSLTESATDMEGVVVTALGIKRQERALGYATTTVKGDELTGAVSSNWTDALSGKVAGLNLVRSNSGPTGSNKIILRGENNLTGDNEALIVVDGVVINQGSGRRTGIGGETVYGTGSDNMPADYGGSLNDINPEDIESVTVLKGPGAAALYGERGGNGAIIITTKSGSSRKKGLGVTFNSNTSMEDVNRWPDLQYEYGQGTNGLPYYSFGAGPDGASTSATSSAYGPRFNGQMFYQYDPVTGTQGTERTLWKAYPDQTRDYFRTGFTTTNTVGVEGGTDKTTARFSFTNVYNKWIMPNTGYKRNTLALSVNSKVSDKLTISSKINYTNKFSDNLPGAGYGNQSIMYWYIFWQPSADMNWLKNYWVPGLEQKKIFYPFSTFPENPYAVAYEFLNSSNRHNVTGNVQALYNITKNLSLQVRASLDMSYEKRAQQRPYDAGSKFQKGSYRTQNIFSQEASGDFLLKYAKKIKDFDLSASFGGSALKNNYNKDEVRADSLTYPGVYSMSNNAGPLETIPWKSEYAINSFYGLITAGYKNFLFMDITGRNDWNSVLATVTRKENVSFFYPSVNLSFIASEVMKLPKQVDFLKLRASLAQVGGGSTIPYRTAFNYTTAGSLYSGGLTNPPLLANPDLKPLRTTTYEVGANFTMFKNRLTFDAAYYTGNTKNQIMERIVDRASGYARSVINIGRVKNTGFELALGGTPVITGSGFKWTTSIIYSTNKNRIEELADSAVVLRTGPVGGGQIVAKVGGSMGDVYGRGYVRAPDGQIVYDAATGFAKISDDVVYLGNTIPKGKLGFSNDFYFKGFHLNLLFDAQWGAVAHSLTHYKLAEQGKLTKTLPGRYNGIIGNGVVDDGTGKYIPNTTVATNIDEYYRSHWGIDNAEGSTFSTDFIKFREARFDYTLNKKLTKKIGLQKVTVGVYGRNLFIWSPWPIFDPEFGTLAGSDIVTGFEVGQFPSTRTIGFNLVVGL